MKYRKKPVVIETEKGRRIPLDPEPVEGGNLAVSAASRSTLTVRVVTPDPSVMRHVSHFSSCPHAHRHRKRERKANG